MSVQEEGRSNQRKIPIVLKVFLILFIVFIITIIVMETTLKPKDLVISNVDLTTISDGLYIGSADNGLVIATVSVEVKDSVIQKITIIEHDNLFGKPAEKIILDVIEKQSLEVDTITSATYSSTTILKAIDNALTNQGKE